MENWALIFEVIRKRGISNVKPCSGLILTERSTTGILSGASHVSGCPAAPSVAVPPSSSSSTFTLGFMIAKAKFVFPPLETETTGSSTSSA